LGSGAALGGGCCVGALGRAGVRGGKGGGCAVLIGEAGGEEEPAGGEV
jgi:hypothetical protein